MKTDQFHYLILIFLLYGCLGSDAIDPEDVVSFDLPTSVIGDGTTSYSIKVILDPDADINFRKLKLVCTGGTFEGAEEKTPNTIVVTASVVNKEIFAEVKWIPPTTPGNVTISAEPVIQDLAGLFKVEHQVAIDTSEAVELLLSTNTFSVQNNFAGEVVITGTLKNANNQGVSKGVKVKIADLFSSDSSEASGRYRQEKLITESNSSISLIYSPGIIASGQDILIVGTALELNNQPTEREALMDTIILHVTEPN